MKAFLIKYSLIIYACFSSVFGFTQDGFEINTIDFYIALPNSWTFQTSEAKTEILIAYSDDSTIQHKISKVAIEDHKNSLDYLNQIEVLLFDLGYSENIADSSNRFKDSTTAGSFNADDISLGVFGFIKKEEYFMQTIIIYHKENWLFVCTTINPTENYFQYAEDIKLITSSFRLKD